MMTILTVAVVSGVVLLAFIALKLHWITNWLDKQGQCQSGQMQGLAMAVLTANDPEHRDDVRQMVQKLKTSGAALLRDVYSR